MNWVRKQKLGEASTLRGKAGLKSNTEKVKIITSCHITSWQIDGETMETMMDFIFLGSKITADSNCSHEIKRCSLLGRKTMTNLDSILISGDITLLTKVCIIKDMVFPVAMYRRLLYSPDVTTLKFQLFQSLKNYPSGKDSSSLEDCKCHLKQSFDHKGKRFLGKWNYKVS